MVSFFFLFQLGNIVTFLKHFFFLRSQISEGGYGFENSIELALELWISVVVRLIENYLILAMPFNTSIFVCFGVEVPIAMLYASISYYGHCAHQFQNGGITKIRHIKNQNSFARYLPQSDNNIYSTLCIIIDAEVFYHFYHDLKTHLTQK